MIQGKMTQHAAIFDLMPMKNIPLYTVKYDTLQCNSVFHIIYDLLFFIIHWVQSIGSCDSPVPTKHSSLPTEYRQTLFELLMSKSLFELKHLFQMSQNILQKMCSVVTGSNMWLRLTFCWRLAVAIVKTQARLSAAYGFWQLELQGGSSSCRGSQRVSNSEKVPRGFQSAH